MEECGEPTTNVSIMVEQVKNNGVRATALLPGSLTTEASTRDETVDRIQTLICEILSPAELIYIEVPVAARPHPWLSLAGTWSDHPDWDEVESNIEEYRREVDADAGR